MPAEQEHTMNLPNKLTVFRCVLVPFFVAFLLGSGGTGPARFAALAVFVIASLTDFLDGYIARSQNLVTDFGKFMDPLADKVLVNSALVCFVGMGRLSPWVLIVILTREFIISGFRLIAAEKGVVIAANMWGKVKTTVQMICVIVMTLNLPQLKLVEEILIWAMTLLTVVSLCVYLKENKALIAEGSR